MVRIEIKSPRMPDTRIYNIFRHFRAICESNCFIVSSFFFFFSLSAKRVDRNTASEFVIFPFNLLSTRSQGFVINKQYYFFLDHLVGAATALGSPCLDPISEPSVCATFICRANTCSDAPRWTT